MKCQVCGLESPYSFTFCPRCGARILKQIRIDKNAIKVPREAITKAVQKRTTTDHVLTPYWIFFILLVLIVTSIVGFAIIFSSILELYQANPNVRPDNQTVIENAKGGLEAIMVGNIVYYVSLAYLVFMLVKRQNDHFDREDELRSGIIALVGSATSSPDQKTLVNNEVSRMNELDNESSAYDKRRSPIFWTMLVVVIPMIINLLSVLLAIEGGYSGSFNSLSSLNLLFELLVIVVTLYLFNFLGSAMRMHDYRWLNFAGSARMALSKLGFPAGSPYSARRLPERSFGLYLLLSIVTIGLFTFYWWYTLLRDPNEHFRYQWQFEDNLVSTLSD
jgi:hypothetical protein